MANPLSPIPAGTAITDGKGIITIFFRLAWQLLLDNLQTTPTAATLDLTGQTARIVTRTLLATTNGGQYRVNYSLQRTVDDGVSSSLQVTVGWTQSGSPQTEVEAALTEAAGISHQGLSRPIFADANTPITIAVAYASNTPAKATFDLHANAEFFQ